MKHKLYNRLLSLALAVGLVIGMLPSAAAVDTVGGQTRDTAEVYTLGKNEFYVQYVDEAGDSIQNRNTKDIPRDTPRDPEYYAVEIPGYSYDHAEINNNTVTQIRYYRPWSSYKLQYYDPNAGWLGGGSWKEWNNNYPLVLVYTGGGSSGGDKLPTFQGEDTSGLITVNVFDYDQSSINSNHTFQFGPTNQGGMFNSYTGSDRGVYQGIVKNTLTNGYPTLNSSLTGSNASLSYLFPKQGTIQNGVTKQVYDANYLFQKDAEGYYWYDSGKNFATLVSENGSTNWNTADFRLNEVSRIFNNVIDPAVPRFLPFNELYSHTYQYAGTGSYVYGLAPNDRKEGKENYYFGMEVDLDFLMPKNGKINDKDMVFEFEGDDDVWVFIDDVLVLDMGGIHDNYSGSINFATGDVYVEKTTNGKAQKTTIEKMFEAAGKTWNGSDYSTHTFKFFYFERGAGGSNAKLKFNLQSIPQGKINFGKDLIYANIADASDIDFQFKTYVDYDGDGSNYELYTGSYEIRQGSTQSAIISSGNNISNGILNLKDDQFATLTDKKIKATSKFYIQEIGATSDKYTVTMDDVEIEDITDGTTTGGVQTDKLTVDDNPLCVFKNSVSVENRFNAIIKKEMSAGQNANGQTFNLQVLLGKEKKVPYNGQYTVYDSNNQQVGGTQTATNGIIQLQAGQYAKITGLMGGNTITVIEKDLSSDFNSPVYEQPTGNAINSSVKNSDGTWSATAKEGNALGNNPQIEFVVTNSLKSGSLTIKKTVVGLDDAALNELKNKLTFTISDGGLTTPITVSGNQITWNGATATYTKNGLPTGTYTVTESNYDVTNYDVTATSSSANGQVVVPANGSGSITFTNTYTRQTGSLTITKTVNGLDDAALNELKNELKFTVTGPDGTTQEIPFSAFNPENGVYTYTLERVPTGTYTVTETDYDTLEKYSWVKEDSTATANADVTKGDTATAELENVYTGKDGTLNINKVVTGFANDGKPVFDFKLTAEDGTVYYYHVDMTGMAIDTEKSATPEGGVTLPVGDYTITELSNQNYTLKSVAGATANNDGTYKVTIKPQETTTVTFTNDPKNTDIPTDGGATENRVDRIEGGVIVWKKDPVEYGKDHDDNITQKPTPEPSVE